MGQNPTAEESKATVAKVNRVLQRFRVVKPKDFPFLAEDSLLSQSTK